jgi:protein-disulfide isomerase
MQRRTFLITATAFAATGPAFAAVGDEATIGAATARLHLIEYASTTCPHCAAFHQTNWATLKARYIDAGRVRFTLRELYTPPAPVALAMFQLARCNDADPAEYIRRVGVMFERQQQIMASGTGAGIRDQLLAIAREWSLTDAQALACFSDETGVQRAQRSMAEADTRGVSATPTFFLGAEQVTDHAFHTTEGMTRILDAELS